MIITMTMTTTLMMSLDGINSSISNADLNLTDKYTDSEIYSKFQPAISIVDKYVTPVWYIVGFPGNIIAFLVWIRPRMRHSSGCYLAALAMADFLFLILQLLFEMQNSWGHKVIEVNVICQIFPILFYASQYLSPLLVLGFTVERYISICHPFQREKFCTTSRAVKVIAGLVLFSLSLHALQGYFWVYENNGCGPRPSVIVGGPRSIWSVWSWVTELMVFGLVPLTILVLNLLVIKEAKQLSDSEEKRLCLKKGTKSSGPSATTFMLLAVSFYLIFTTLPVTITYAMYLTFPMGSWYMTEAEFLVDPTWQSHLTFTTARTIIQEFCMSHYACNVFIYLLTGKQFRTELCIYVCRNKQTNWHWSEENKPKSVRTQMTTTNGSVAHL